MGYLKIPCDGSPSFRFVRSYYTPQIPATILSPDALGLALDCKGYHTFSDFVDNVASLTFSDCSKAKTGVSFSLLRIRGLLFTDALLAPTMGQHRASHLPVDSSAASDALPIRVVDACACSPPDALPVLFPQANACTCQDALPLRTLTREQERALWHMRLGHIHERKVSDLHKHVDGVPHLPREDVLHKCPMCARAKLHKTSRGSEEPVPEDTGCWQHIQVDFAFFVQKSQGRLPAKKARSRSKRPATTRFLMPLDSPLRVHEEAMHASRESPLLLAPLRRSSRLASSTVSPIPVPDPIPPEPPPEPPPAPPVQPSVASDAPSFGFQRIYAHEGPFHPKHRRYKGSQYNLRIRWDDGSTTWEPRDIFLEDCPSAVALYARDSRLLHLADWSFLRASLSPTDPHAASSPTTMGDLEDATELLDGTTLDPALALFPPLTAAQTDAKAASAAARYERLKGLNGETCYVLITCRKTGAWKVSIRTSKDPPLDFFREWLATHASSATDRSVRFDLGGELGGCTAVHELFSKAGYDVETTAPDSSSEIGQVERPHRFIADGVRTMLFAAGLPPKFWPYALRHFVFLANCVPRGSRPAAPITMCTGKRINLSLLRVFGCRMFALPAKDRDAKIDVNARPGIFLGYQKSMRNAFFYDSVEKKVLTARHIAFDEGFNGDAKPPPYVRFLKGDLSLEEVDLTDATSDMQVSLSPFNEIDVVDTPFTPRAMNPLGFSFGPCPLFLRAYVNKFDRNFGPYPPSVATRKYVGGYIIKVGDIFTFSPADVTAAIRSYAALPTPPKSLRIHIARDQRTHLSARRPPPLRLRPIDIRRITALNLVAGEGTENSPLSREDLRRLASTPPLSYTPPDADDLESPEPDSLLEMRKLQNDYMTDEEKALKSFTRKNLMKLSNWSDWQAADNKQLDSHFNAGTIGMAVPRPSSSELSPSQVFRIVWARLVKATGVRKSRACLDGSKRAAPWLRALVQTYASCIELPCLRAFLAICAVRGYYICFGDVENAYQQSPPPTVECYLEVDDTVFDWYLRKFNVKLDRFKEVIPLFKALQGHPEAGALWERMITDILVNKMDFRHTTHERNLYVGSVDGREVLVCRQVDDFASGASTKEAAERFIHEVQKHVKAEFDGMGIETGEGLYQRFNGIDIYQTQDFIKVGCESYLDRMLQTHGWDSPKHKDPINLVPIHPSITDKLMTLEGPDKKSPQATLLVQKHGFSYRNLLGELVYAYVICRLDIGYAICFLARFSTNPHDEHFRALKGVCRYLRSTKSWGIIYQRPSPLLGLPYVEFAYLPEDTELPKFPRFFRDELIGTLDAAHGTDLRTRRSVTGLVIFYCCAAIAWKSRLQSVVSTSSTEAEFYSAVTCAKLLLYLRYIMQELDAIRPGPSPMYIDNEAAIHMINERRPTPRARHIEIQHFAIQEWRDRGDVFTRHIPGTVNNSDDLTKPLGWVLHKRHAPRSMGHYKIRSPEEASHTAHSPYTRMRASEAGEGVGDRSSHESGTLLSATTKDIVTRQIVEL